MRQVDDYLFTGHTAIQEGVYIVAPEFFWTFLSAGEFIETGICDWWYDVAAIYPEETIIFFPVDTTKDVIELGPDTLYRGVHELDEDPELLCYYAVIGKTTRLTE